VIQSTPVIGLQALIIAAVLVAAAVERQARAEAWRRIAEARRYDNSARCRHRCSEQ
jgi:hypothetical protein